MRDRDCNHCKNYDPSDGVCSKDGKRHHYYEYGCPYFVKWNDVDGYVPPLAWYMIRLEKIRNCEDCPIYSECRFKRDFHDRDLISECPMIELKSVSADKEDCVKRIEAITTEEWKI